MTASQTEDNSPVLVVSKIVKATRRVGSVSTGLPGISQGTLYYRAYQKSAGSNKHSGPSGRRAFRFYQGAHSSSPKKLTKKMTTRV